ncbi:MAG: hypothetical protein AAF497_02280 [Planctomycetota bacterium]
MNWLRRLFAVTESKEDQHLELDVQQLEDRLYLAGNVDVSYNERTGDLFVRADRESNRIRISANDSGRIVVEGLQRAGSRTTINDSGTSFVINQTRNGVIPDDLIILTRPGNDFVEIDGIKVNDDLRISGGGQNDSYKLTNVETGGRLTATGGGGDDHILVQDSKFIEAFMPTGGGQDFVGWNNTQMPGRGRFILGGGLDGFVMSDSIVNGEIYLNTGGQEDAVYWTNSIVKTEVDILLGGFDDTLVIADGTRLPGDTIIRPLGARNNDKLVMDDTVNVRRDIVDSFGQTFVEDNDVVGRFELSIGLPIDFLEDTFTSRGFARRDFPLEIPADDYTSYYPFAERWQFASELNGDIERGYDFDWHLVRLNQGEQYTFETFAGTLDKTRLQLYDRNGVQVAIDSDGGVGKLSKLSYRAQYTGVYYLGVSSNVDHTGTYTVRRV